jgi:hypothetical protein
MATVSSVILEAKLSEKIGNWELSLRMTWFGFATKRENSGKSFATKRSEENKRFNCQLRVSN